LFKCYHFLFAKSLVRRSWAKADRTYFWFFCIIYSLLIICLDQIIHRRFLNCDITCQVFCVCFPFIKQKKFCLQLYNLINVKRVLLEISYSVKQIFLRYLAAIWNTFSFTGHIIKQLYICMWSIISNLININVLLKTSLYLFPSSYDNKDIALSCGIMLRECIKFPSLGR